MRKAGREKLRRENERVTKEEKESRKKKRKDN